eukprot:TRINITY_DN7717_c0_g1_i1.p1 TRINITY_DN7717_c0_g1~~TRINITY_DN7717_c0_g1_i1.p1  ORF type:complete len:266 (+),score=63.94 TRINITY_DN7717_c0_g1_i1:52-798(+)
MVKSALKEKGAPKGDEKVVKKESKKVTVEGGKKKKIQKERRVVKDKKNGVLYIGHIPHGYYEGPMRTFLSQYGKIKRLRLSRSKKSGASKGYGFVQFEDPEVAAAVAEELNGQYVTGKVLKVDPMDPEQVHKNLWKGLKVKTLMRKDADIRINGHIQHHIELAKKSMEQTLMESIATERQINKKLGAKGITYKFTGFEDQLKVLGVEYVPKAKKTDATSAGKQAKAAPIAAAVAAATPAPKKAKKSKK